MQSETPAPKNKNLAPVLGTAAVVALGVLVWWAVEIRTTPPPPPVDNAPALEPTGSR